MKVDVTKYKNGQFTNQKDILAIEEPIEIVLKEHLLLFYFEAPNTILISHMAFYVQKV